MQEHDAESFFALPRVKAGGRGNGAGTRRNPAVIRRSIITRLGLDDDLTQRASFPDDVSRIVSESNLSDEVGGLLEVCTGGWSIDAHLGRVLYNAVCALDCRSILEFGAGASSLLFAKILQSRQGGQLTSIEQDPEWCKDRWDEVRKCESVDSQMIVSRPTTAMGRMGLYALHRDAREELGIRAPFQLVLIDGPQAHRGREGAMPLIYDLLPVGTLIFLDDAARRGERIAIWKWLMSYPGLQLEYFDAAFGSKGLAVLRKSRPIEPRFSLGCYIVGLNQGFKRWRRMHRNYASAVG